MNLHHTDVASAEPGSSEARGVGLFPLLTRDCFGEAFIPPLPLLLGE